MKTTEKNQLAIDVGTAARRIGLSRNGMYEAVARGEIPSIRIGRRLLIPVHALEALFAKAGSQPARASD
jgi:excisionase family DNA binding protein